MELVPASIERNLLLVFDGARWDGRLNLEERGLWQTCRSSYGGICARGSLGHSWKVSTSYVSSTSCLSRLSSSLQRPNSDSLSQGNNKTYSMTLPEPPLQHPQQ
eukprot:1161187-Pelagomonas_calceolata.AAC.12